jgi:hypothetical protein
LPSSIERHDLDGDQTCQPSLKHQTLALASAGYKQDVGLSKDQGVDDVDLRVFWCLLQIVLWMEHLEYLDQASLHNVSIRFACLKAPAGVVHKLLHLLGGPIGARMSWRGDVG